MISSFSLPLSDLIVEEKGGGGDFNNNKNGVSS